MIKSFQIALICIGLFAVSADAAVVSIPIKISGTVKSGGSSSLSASYSGRKGSNSVRGSGNGKKTGGVYGSYRGVIRSTARSSRGAQRSTDRGTLRLSKTRLRTPFGSIRVKRISASKARQRLSGRGTVRVEVP